jgi:hypothetical protein
MSCRLCRHRVVKSAGQNQSAQQVPRSVSGDFHLTWCAACLFALLLANLRVEVGGGYTAAVIQLS